MLEATINSKLPEGHESSEDLLTSTALGLLQYMPVDPFWVNLLSQAKTVTGTPFSHQFGSDLASAMLRLCFWPSHPTHGEPDILAFLTLADGEVVIFVIEVKLGSSKSGYGENDQLLKYLSAMKDNNWLKTTLGTKVMPNILRQGGLIYLTVLPGFNDIKDSLQEAGRRQLEGVEDMIFDLSWQDVHAAAHRHTDLPFPAGDIARKTAKFLEFRGLKYFDGFHIKFPTNSGILKTVGRHYSARPYFKSAVCRIQNSQVGDVRNQGRYYQGDQK